MNKVALIVLDGLGLNPDARGNAVTRDTMPFLHGLIDELGHAQLAASGQDVGLDPGQCGNSEVGHLTIGAGRVVGTALTRIRTAFETGSWSGDPIWHRLTSHRRVHVAGLLSDAGVHAHLSSMIQTARLARRAGAENVVLHPFLDGVDSARGTAPALLRTLDDAFASDPCVRIGSVSGRRWACDRSGSLDITAHCVDGLRGRLPAPTYTPAALDAHLQHSGEATFPFHTGSDVLPLGLGEPVVLTHHRADRIAQLARALSIGNEVYGLVELDDVVPIQQVFFRTEVLRGGLADTLEANGVALTRVAESCKLPHITFFLDGMRKRGDRCVEIPTIPEHRIPMQPEMSLPQLTSAVCDLLASEDERALAVNIPNLDQVGHTGDFELANRAAALVDVALRAIHQQARKHDWTLLITADHGNADQMLDDKGAPLGSHSMHPVPLIVVDPRRIRHLRQTNGTLAHIAPTFLALSGLPTPPAMVTPLVDPN